jgi:hypothetical protein
MMSPHQTPEEVRREREEMLERSKQAAAAAKRRMKNTPDKTALYLGQSRASAVSSMANEFDDTYRPLTAYLRPMFRTTALRGPGTVRNTPGLQGTAKFPSAEAGIAAATGTGSNSGVLADSLCGSCAAQLLPDTTDILCTLRKYKTTQELCQKSERGHKQKHASHVAASALNSPFISTVKKPSHYRLTNGMIGGGQTTKLCWLAGEDEDSVVLPALPLTITEETDPVKKHIDQV